MNDGTVPSRTENDTRMFMVDCCSVIYCLSAPLLHNSIRHIWKDFFFLTSSSMQVGGIVLVTIVIRVSWRFESQKMSVGNPLRNQATSGSKNGLIPMLGSPTSMFVLIFHRHRQVHCQFAISIYSLFLFSPMKDAPFLWKWEAQKPILNRYH
jgi:hypothetical protein